MFYVILALLVGVYFFRREKGAKYRQKSWETLRRIVGYFYKISIGFHFSFEVQELP